MTAANPSNGVFTSGETYELLVLAIQRLKARLGPKSPRIIFNHHVPHRGQGAPRQIDVALFVDNGDGTETFIAVECKNLTRHIDIKLIEELAQFRQNVGASRLILCTRTDVSKLAAEEAGLQNIDIAVVNAARDVEWPTWLQQPEFKASIMEFHIEHATLNFVGGGHLVLPQAPGRLAPIVVTQAGEKLTAADVLHRMVSQVRGTVSNWQTVAKMTRVPLSVTATAKFDKPCRCPGPRRKSRPPVESVTVRSTIRERTVRVPGELIAVRGARTGAPQELYLVSKGIELNGKPNEITVGPLRPDEGKPHDLLRKVDIGDG